MESGKTRSNIVSNTLLSISQVLFPLITFPYASRILGPAGVGLVGFADSITQYFILFAALGVPLYGIREVAKVKNDKKHLIKFFNELFFLHLLLTSCCVVLYVALFMLVPQLHMDKVVYCIGTGILFFSVFPCEWFFQGTEKFRLIATRTIAVRFFSILMLFIMVRKEEDAWKYYGINLLTIVINSLVNFYYIRKDGIIISLDSLNIKSHLKPLIYIFSSNVIVSVYILMDSILLGFLTNTIVVGYYTTAVKLNRVLLALISGFSLVMIPRLTVAFNDRNYNQAATLLSRSFNYVVFIGIPVTIGLALVAPDIIALFAGSQFGPSASVLRITSSLILLIGLSNIFGMQILIPLGKEKILLLVVSCGMIVSLLLNLLLIPIWTYNGAALASISAELSVTVLSGFIAYKYFRYKIEFAFFAKAVISSLIFIPVYWLVYQLPVTNLWKLIGMVSLSALTYFLIQWYVFRNELVNVGLQWFRGFVKGKVGAKSSHSY